MRNIYRALLPVLLLVVAACTQAPAASPTPNPSPSDGQSLTPGPSATPSPSPSGPQAGLDGRSFLSTGVTQGGEPRPLVGNTRIRLDFDGDNLGASAGCNSIGGNYQLDEDRLMFSGGSMTEMGCDPARHAQDDWLVAFLGSNPAVALNGNDLVLTSGDTVITLLDSEVAEPDQQLTGTSWLLTTIFNAETATSIPEGVVATLTFNEDGTVDVMPGCNSGSGTYTVDGDQITFGPIALTRMACQGAGGQVEADVVTVLEADAVTFSIDASSLTLESDVGGLQFTAQ